MPLSELIYGLSRGKVESSQNRSAPICSTDLSFLPINDFHELIWENGQIQSSKDKNFQASKGFPSQNLRIGDKDSGDKSIFKCSTMEPLLNEVQISVPSVVTDLNHDDNTVPWLNYLVDKRVQQNYDSELLPELSTVTVTEHSSGGAFASLDRSSGNGFTKDFSNSVSKHNGLRLNEEDEPKFSSADRNSATQLCPSLSQQHHASFPYFRSRVLANDGENIDNVTNLAVSAVQVPNSGGGFPSIKMQKQMEPATSYTSSINFSYFSRPVALVKANLQSLSMRANSGIATMESKYKCFNERDSNPAQSTLIDSCSRLQKQNSSNSYPVRMTSKVNAKPLEAKLAEEHAHVELTEALDQDDSKKDKNSCKISVESARKDFTENERSTELAVASSSVCSGNNTERNLDDPIHNLKRKHFDHEEAEGLVEDAEKESVAKKKATPIRRGTGSKRGRAAEVHNLSERKRRDRINEKMRALQELIPNCNNKVDKASMLDEATDYLKTLQLQVQMMSMGAGFYMPLMTMPLGVPHVHAAQMAQFYPLDIGIAMGFGMGMPKMDSISSTCPMLQVPPFHGAQFHGPLPLVPSALHGMGGSNLQMFGVCGQGLPMPFQPPPMMPMSAGPLLKTRSGLEICSMVGPRKNQDEAVAFSSKNLIQSLKMQAMLNKDDNGSTDWMPSQYQGANEYLERSSLVQTSTAADNGALELVTGNNNASGEGAAGPD